MVGTFSMDITIPQLDACNFSKGVADWKIICHPQGRSWGESSLESEDWASRVHIWQQYCNYRPAVSIIKAGMSRRILVSAGAVQRPFASISRHGSYIQVRLGVWAEFKSQETLKTRSLLEVSFFLF